MAEPVSLADLKAHLRLDASETDENALLDGFMLAARRALELHTGRVIVGANPTLDPADLPLVEHAIKVTCTAWYENREGEQALPPAAIALMRGVVIIGAPA